MKPSKLAHSKLERQGEGDAITVVRHPITSANGSTQQISFEFALARVPDRRYPAEVGGVVKSEYMVRLYFGQSKSVGNGLSTLLMIHIPFVAIRQFVDSVAAGLEERSITFFTFLENSMPTLLDLTKETEQPSSTVTLEANIIAFAFHGREACMDFYHASPFVWDSFLKRGGKFYAEPVVRVTLTTLLSISLIKSMESLVKSFPAEIKEEML